MLQIKTQCAPGVHVYDTVNGAVKVNWFPNLGPYDLAKILAIDYLLCEKFGQEYSEHSAIVRTYNLRYVWEHGAKIHLNYKAVVDNMDSLITQYKEHYVD